MRHAATGLGGDGAILEEAKASSSSLSSNCLIMRPNDLALVSHTPIIPMRIAAKYGVDAASDPRDTIRTYNWVLLAYGGGNGRG